MNAINATSAVRTATHSLAQLWINHINKEKRKLLYIDEKKTFVGQKQQSRKQI
jgi:hypothetical protein